MNSRQITADEIRNLSLAEKISIVENILDSTVFDITMNHSVDAGFYPAVPSDIDGDDSADLADAISALRILSGIEPDIPISLSADVKGDDRIGIEEVIIFLTAKTKSLSEWLNVCVYNTTCSCGFYFQIYGVVA